MPLPSDTLTLLLSHLQDIDYVLAAPEDAHYFRMSAKASSKPMPPKIKEEAPPSFKPLVQEIPQPISPPPTPKPLPPKQEVAPPEAPPPLQKPSTDFAHIRRILSLVAPELALLDDIPSDTTAKKIAERWKTKNQTAPISLLLFQEPPEQRALLEQMAKAIDIYFGPAKIVQAESIEKEKQWEAFLSVADLKLVIVCDYTLWQLSQLMHFYRETPAQGVRTLANVPLFLLPDLSLYLKDPLLKRSLWKALCQKCS